MRGVILGKFLPPHRGHELLIDVARRDQAARGGTLTVLVCGTGGHDPIPPRLRAHWIARTFSDVEVAVLDEPIQQEPAHTDPAADTAFWDMWRRILTCTVGARPDVIYSSEPYARRLADDLGAESFCVDRYRQVIDVDGTRLRHGLLTGFDQLLAAARADIVVKVAIVGAESCGKSTGAAELARHYGTCYVPEHARDVLEDHDNDAALALFDRFVRGQRALTAAAAHHADRVLICDTDELTTLLWARVLHGHEPAELRRAVDELTRPRLFDHYLLYDTDLAFHQDGTRALNGARRHTTAMFATELEARGLPYTIVRGHGQQRHRAAIDVIDRLLAERDQPITFPSRPLHWAQRCEARASRDACAARLRDVEVPRDELVLDPTLRPTHHHATSTRP